jgi:hypothetical protein
MSARGNSAMSISFRQSEPPPPPLEHELFRCRKPDGREAWLVLRELRPHGVELRQLLQRQPGGADAELLCSKFYRYGYSLEDLNDAVLATCLKWEVAGWTPVEPTRPPEA